MTDGFTSVRRGKGSITDSNSCALEPELQTPVWSLTWAAGDADRKETTFHTEALLAAINTPRPPTVEPALRQRAPWGERTLHPVQPVEQHVPHPACSALFS